MHAALTFRWWTVATFEQEPLDAAATLRDIGFENEG
jgi:hypothetical protein